MIARCLVRQTTAKNYTFDYLIPEDMQLEKLCLVEVPFLNKKREAVVLEIRQSSRYAKKNIIRKLSYGAVFTSQQLLLAKKIAYEFLSDPSSALFSFLPTLNKSDLKKIGSLKRRSIHQKRKPLVVISDWDYRVSYYLQSINKSQQNLIILPKISLIKKFSKQITTLDPSQKVYIWHSAISSREKSLIWQKLLSGENLTIVATRHGLFLPFTNLVLTIIDQPDDFSYFEDQAPRYNAKAAAKLANSIYLGQLIFGDTLISPEIYAWTSSGKAVLSNKEDEIKFINASGLSRLSSLDESILALKNSKKILITGFFKSSSDLVCMDCERIIKQDYISSSICPHCNSPKPGKKITKKKKKQFKQKII